MLRRSSLLAAVLALAAAAPALAAGDAAVVVAPPGLAEGDADAALAALLGVVERDRAGPLGQAALVAARPLWDESRDVGPHVKRLEALLARGGLQGDVDETVRRLLGERYLESGDLAKRAAVGVDAGYLGDFLVCGTFGVAARAAVHVPYPPETSIDLEKEMPGRRGPVRWIPYRSLGIGEIVEPHQYLRPTDGVAFALAQVRSEKGGPAVLKMTCRGSHSLRLNGALVLERDRLRSEPARTAWVPVTLAAGWNRILVKLAGTEGFALKVCDPDTGLPLRGLEVETKPVLHPAVPALPAPASVAFRSNLDAVLAAEPATPEDRVVRAFLAGSYDLPWTRWTDLEKAAALAPGDPGIQFRFAEFVEEFREMPEPRWRKNRARALYENVLEASPGHVPAVLALAGMLSGEDRTEEALAGIKPLPEAKGEADAAAAATRAALERSRRIFPGLDALLADRPLLAEGWWTRSLFCQARNWPKEAEDAARNALEANPRHAGALNHLLRLADGYGDAKGAEAACRSVLAADRGNSRAARRLAEILRDRGDGEGCRKALEEIVATWPSDFDARAELARHHAAGKRWDEALACWRWLEAQSPLDPSYPREIGALLRLKGDDEGAKAAWRRSLDLDGAQGPLRRELERLEGGDFDFARPWIVDGVALAKDVGGQEKYPKAVSVHVLDMQVVRVNDDGSWTSITHDVHRILNEKGREKYSEITLPGQVLEVRAISPEGEVFLPIGARGNTFTLEGLQAGWTVETRYLNDGRRADTGYDGGGWYFRDPGFERGEDPDPVILSKLVVDMPASMEVPLLLRNYGPAPAPAVEGGRKVFVFEKRDQDRVEAEPGMPGAEEICPYAHFHQPGSWENVNLEALDLLPRFATSPILEEKARAATSGIEGNLARAKALYDAVNAEILGNAGNWGPTGVLLERSGNRFLCFGALLTAARIPFDLVRVSTGPEEGKTWEIASEDLFPSVGLLVRGPDDAAMDDDAFVFPFARHTPFGRVPEDARGKRAFVPHPHGPAMFRMPAGDDGDLEMRTAAAVVLGAAPADTTFTLDHRNPDDGWYGSKERIKDMNEDDRRKDTARTVERFLPAANLKDYSYPGLLEAGLPFRLTASGGLPQALREEGGSMVLGLGIDPLDASGRYVERPERNWPFLLQDSDVRTDAVTYDLGGSWTVASLPRGHTAVGRIGTYSLVVEKEDGRVRVERRVRFSPCRYSPDEYREFVAWCRAIDAAEEQRIVLAPAK